MVLRLRALRNVGRCGMRGEGLRSGIASIATYKMEINSKENRRCGVRKVKRGGRKCGHFH